MENLLVGKSCSLENVLVDIIVSSMALEISMGFSVRFILLSEEYRKPSVVINDTLAGIQYVAL